MWDWIYGVRAGEWFTLVAGFFTLAGVLLTLIVTGCRERKRVADEREESIRQETLAAFSHYAGTVLTVQRTGATLALPHSWPMVIGSNEDADEYLHRNRDHFERAMNERMLTRTQLLTALLELDKAKFHLDLTCRDQNILTRVNRVESDIEQATTAVLEGVRLYYSDNIVDAYPQFNMAFQSFRKIPEESLADLNEAGQTALRLAV